MEHKMAPFVLRPGQLALPFTLPGTDGRNYSLSDFSFAKFLVLFVTVQIPLTSGYMYLD